MTATVAHEPDIQGSLAATLERLQAVLASTEILLRASYEQGCDDTREAILGGRRPRRSRPAPSGTGPDLRLVTAESVRLVLEAAP